jgi:hypothetical protein
MHGSQASSAHGRLYSCTKLHHSEAVCEILNPCKCLWLRPTNTVIDQPGGLTSEFLLCVGEISIFAAMMGGSEDAERAAALHSETFCAKCCA